MSEGPIRDRKRWVAVLAAVSLPGMGQVYNGELVKGICFFGLSLMTVFSGLRLTDALPDGWLALGLGSTLLLSLAAYGFAIFDALSVAAITGPGYRLRACNRWYFYLAAWMLGAFFVAEPSFMGTREDIVELYKIAGASMEPQVMVGDRVIVDKTAYRRFPPAVGDVVVHVFPDDRSKVFIRRVEGLPGDTVRLAGGRETTVPHGEVCVLGNGREGSLDSRVFGTIPLRDVVGKARQVYWSSGADGVRWERIGKTIGPRP